MIHRIILPVKTKTALSRVVELQTILLVTAAYHRPRARGANFRAECRSAIIAAFPSSGPAIADWVIGKRGRTTRFRLLSRFASYSSVSQKVTLIQPWVNQMLDFLVAKGRPNLPTPYTATYWWEIAAWDFLLSFYKQVLGDSGAVTTFPDALTGVGTFGRPEFLNEHVTANRHLSICPACDESDYRSEPPAAILTQVDHFFPSSLYPHLAVHPYNLVPICGPCNLKKLNRDPLAAGLTDLTLPYRGALRSQSYVSFQPRGPGKPDLLNRATKAIAPNLQAHSALFDVPQRWSGRRNLDQFLLEQLIAWLGSLVRAPITPGQLIDQLDLLSGTLHRYEAGRQGLALTLAWWASDEAKQLAVQLAAQAAGGGTVKSPLLAELNRRPRLNARPWEKLRRTGARLRDNLP